MVLFLQVVMNLCSIFQSFFSGFECKVRSSIQASMECLVSSISEGTAN